MGLLDDVSLGRRIALRCTEVLSSTGFSLCGLSCGQSTVHRLNRLRKWCFVYHSERSEESLPIENKRPRGILRANSALRMTVFRFFPQPVQPRHQNPNENWTLAPAV